MEYNTSEFLIETEVPDGELIVSRTDLKGIITYANETFAEISGYALNELVGKSHNVVRHPDMPSAAFIDLWDKLNVGAKWSGYVKNLRKDSGYYWVFAQISGIYKDDKLVEYKSVRTPISFEEKVTHQKLYDDMRNQANERIRTISYSN